ncbi:MAG: cyanophycinase [Anaerolineaceae bacterium]|nr:cyanophycinase [Anaerolineaceae bacterium]
MTIIAIGGNVDLHGAVMQEFYRRSGGQNGHFVILPTASALIDTGDTQATALEELGASQKPTVLPIRQRLQADNPEYLSAVQNATGIFLCGGDQLRLTTVLGGTQLHSALLKAAQNGCIIAGTSAGAAAFSHVMISRGHNGQAARNGIAQFSSGLGFENRIIFDQHFNQRNRMGRLIYAITTNPSLLGVGIDENTAALIENNIVEIYGQNAVTVVDGHRLSNSNIADLNHRDYLAVSGMTLHVLTRGCRYLIDQRTAEIPNFPSGGE